ncbi:unnamed protein product [Adineta steineri]|uniref:RRM domain-containing protein n=1 Tax=Adineta steineri TaxID=433720 RepID=A0A815SV67_9BILA|nr:unnamed protein product [Adineta steineri]CAF1494672.1 unnamed protein product [Adineta steineri]
MPNLVGIYIFCGNEAFHTEWTTNWPKIKLVSTKIESICNAMQKELIDSIPKKDTALPVEEKKDKSKEQTPNPELPVKEDTSKEDTLKEDTPNKQTTNPELPVKEDTPKEDTPNKQTTNPELPVKEDTPKEDTLKKQTTNPELPVEEDTLNEQVPNPQLLAKENEDHILGPELNQEESENTDDTDSVASESNAGESNAGESNASKSVAVEYVASKSVAGESNASESVASKSVTGESNAGESVTGESNAGESVTGKSVAGEYVASKSVADESIASKSVTGESVISESVASKSVAGNLNDTPLFKKNAIFISGLPSTMIEQLLFNTLYDEFGTVGPIKIDTQTKKSCVFLFRSKKNNDELSGNAEITFENEEAVEEAIKKYNQMCVLTLNNARIGVKQSKMKSAVLPQRQLELVLPLPSEVLSDEESESTDDTNSVASGSLVGEPGVNKPGNHTPNVGGLANGGLFKKNAIFINGLPSTIEEQLLFDTLWDEFSTIGPIKIDKQTKEPSICFVKNQQRNQEESENTDNTDSIASESVADDLNDVPMFKKNTVFISSLPSTMPEQLLFDTLQNEFGTVGPIKFDKRRNKSSIHLFKNKNNNAQLTGCAEITFKNEEAVEEAIKKYNRNFQSSCVFRSTKYLSYLL